MSNDINKIYAFDEFVINLRERNLWRGDELLPLPPKVFDTLAALVENAGETLSKDEILQRVWPDSFVEESNLSQNIYLLRQTFGKERDYIRTVPRRGYKFIAEVRPVETTAAADPPSPGRTVGKSRYAIAAAVAVVLTAAAAIFGITYIVPAEAEETAAAAYAPASIKLSKLTDSGTAFFPALSPAGDFIAYVERGAPTSVHLMDVATGRDVVIPIEGGPRPGTVEFASEGKRIIYRASGMLRAGLPLYQVSYFGGVPREITDNVWGKFSISADGTEAALFRVDVGLNRERVAILDIETGNETSIFEVSVPDHLFLYAAPVFSPDGKKIAFVKRPAGDTRSVITVFDRDTGKAADIATRLEKIFNIVWHPNGQGIFAISKEGEKGRQIWHVRTADAGLTRVTNDLNSYDGLSISRDGTKIVTQQRDFSSNIWVFPGGSAADGKAVTSGRYGHFGVSDLEFATEGRIIFEGRTSVDKDLVASTIDGGVRTQLTENSGIVNTGITATTDGRYVYITSNRSGTPAIWRLTQDGREAFQITDPKNEAHWYPALAHNESALFYVARTPKGSVIRRRALDSAAEQVIFEQQGVSPTTFLEASPDGRYLAFVYKAEDEVADSDEPLNYPVKIGILELAGGGLNAFTIRAAKPRIRWTNGGRTFDYIRGSAIFRQTTADPDAVPQKIFELPGERIFNFDWSFSGTDLVVARGGQVSDLVMISID